MFHHLKQTFVGVGAKMPQKIVMCLPISLQQNCVVFRSFGEQFALETPRFFPQRLLEHSHAPVTLGVYGQAIGTQQRDAVDNRSKRIARYAAN